MNQVNDPRLEYKVQISIQCKPNKNHKFDALVHIIVASEMNYSREG
jgi:hypothetical protein